MRIYLAPKQYPFEWIDTDLLNVIPYLDLINNHNMLDCYFVHNYAAHGFSIDAIKNNVSLIKALASSDSVCLNAVPIIFFELNVFSPEFRQITEKYFPLWWYANKQSLEKRIALESFITAIGDYCGKNL